MFLFPKILDFITKVSTTLPEDVQHALQSARKKEKNISATMAIDVIEKNIQLANQEKVPLCQDTGFPTFYISYHSGLNTSFITDQIKTAMRMATRKGILRPNAVESLSGKNSGDNSGKNFPKIVYIQDSSLEKDHIKIQLILKGGGSENVSGQLALPCETDFGRANRNLEGVEKAVLQIVKNAEGKGCSPGIIGVHIGGDRGTGFEESKKNLFRKLQSVNENEELEDLEKKICNKANNLDIGPMGFGGKTTLLDCFISHSHRLPASFFVTVTYNCWALRRGEIILNLSETKNNSGTPTKKNSDSEKFLSEKEVDFSQAKRLSFPLKNEDVDSLKKGDIVLLSGSIFTGRDMVHHHVVEENNKLPIDITGSAIYHCGPIMKKNSSDEWECISAGPTTSIREEAYQADFIETTGIKAVIGKGNMGEKTLKALQKNKAVYFHAIGGAGAVYAKSIKKVSNVFFLEEFGMPEALWKLEIKDFPVIVTMK